jgi:FkbM family methyltransferase
MDSIAKKNNTFSIPVWQADQALARGLKAHGAGRLAEAILAYDQALALRPDMAAALVNKGVALRGLGRMEEAIACYWQAIALDPTKREVYINAGNALQQMGRRDEALALMRVALRQAPQKSDSWLALGKLLASRHPAAAEACLRRSIALAPSDIVARAQLATLLRSQGKLDQAFAHYSLWHVLAPDDVAALSGGGAALLGLNRMSEAHSWFGRALILDEHSGEAGEGLTHIRLLKGQFPAAWGDYLRYRPPSKQSDLPGTLWDGSDPAGKTILVSVDLAIDETLHLLRYLPLLAQRKAKILLSCPASFLDLLSGAAGVTTLLANGQKSPKQCALHIPLSLLPVRLQNIPAATTAPYLTATRPAIAWQSPIGSRLKVGLAWVGDPLRSLTLESLLPLAAIPGVALCSLQTGKPAEALKRVGHPALIADLSDRLRDVADVAAAIAGLDLVITADGAIAHLAGAMGKPVWVVASFAPDWRWGLRGERTDWYPSMRLFRQTAPDDREGAIDKIVAALRELVATKPEPQALQADIVVRSIFPDGKGKPRFTMTAPRAFLADPGVRFLVNKEFSGAGYEYATRSFIDAHLLPDDLFIDVGAHWGIMSLQAVTRWPGKVKALAFEPLPANLPHLRRWIADNRLADAIEVIPAAASDGAGKGRLKPESTMGHSLIKAEDGPIAVVTIDQILADRPHLADRRAIVKIDVEGSEIDVIGGMANLLDSERVAAVIWERGIEYDRAEGRKRQAKLRQAFRQRGFTAWYFASEDEGGTLLPFEDDKSAWHGNVFELASGSTPLENYGLSRPAPVTQPADPALESALKARHLFQAGFAAQKKGKTQEASTLYGEAAMLDDSVPGLANNLGVLLRDGGRQAAAIACYYRALGRNPEDTSVMSNLGNALRDLGRLAETEKVQARALCLQSDHASLLYNAGVMHKDAGRPEQALPLFDRALLLDPDNADYRWDRALVLLQLGNYAEGFPAYESRWGLKRAHKRDIRLPRWDGSPLQGRSITLTDEQGFGDVLQFARFVPEVKRRGAGRIILECQPELMRLMALCPDVDGVIPREKAALTTDLTIPLLSLPGLFGTTLESLPAKVPYLRAPAAERLLADDGSLKLGLVWAGKPTPRDRSCPLELLLPLLGDPGYAPYSLQVGPRAADLKAQGGDAFVTDLGPALHDFAETAAMLKQLDLLVTVDTSIAHLAGALGVKTFLLLRYTSDWRWFDRGSTSPWYPSMTLFRQHVPNRWDEALEDLAARLEEEHVL